MLRQCYCGEYLDKTIKDISTYYSNKKITVRNVPAYECALMHTQMARETRVKITELLKDAYEKNIDDIHYK